MYSICFTIAGVIFSILLFIIYSFKTNFSISENKIYHSIIITTIITGLIEIYSFILVKNNIPENSNLYLFALKFLFLGFVTWLYLFTLYTVIVTLKLKDKDNDKYRIILVISSIIFTILSIITIILPISINKVGDLLLPTGSGVEVIYLLAVLCFIIMIIAIISNHKELKNKKYYPVYFLLVILGIMILIQKIFPDLLLINFSLSIIIYIMYFTIENPDIKLSKELKYTKELLNKRNELASNTINNLIISIKEPLTEIECYDSADRYIPTLERLYPLLTLNQALLVTQTEIDRKFTSLAVPLYSASAVGRLDIFKHLLKEQKKWKFEKSERIELMNSLIDNNLPDFVEALASSGMSIKDYEHPSLPIVRAVCDLSNGTKDEERLVQVVEVLLKWGASIEAIKLNDETYTPLICAQKRASLSRLVDLLQTKSSQQAHQKPIFSINSSWLGQYLKSDLTKMEKRKSQVMQCEKIGQCVASGGTWDVSMRDYNGYCIKDNEPACLARGGTWRRICLSQSLACVMAYPDADKDCTDGSQCISGRCLANRGKSKPEEDGLIHGQCKRNNDPCGCFSSINNGKTRGSMCVD